jgi:acyl carrier protein
VKSTGDTFVTLTEIISALCGIDRLMLRPDTRIEDIDLDSLFAGEIIAQTERRLAVDLDFRKISDDWSALTLGDLVRQIDDAR